MIDCTLPTNKTFCRQINNVYVGMIENDYPGRGWRKTLMGKFQNFSKMMVKSIEVIP